MENIGAFAEHLKGKTGRLGEFPTSQKKIRVCDGPCRSNIFLQTFKDGSTKETGCKCQQVLKDREIIKVKKANGFINASRVPFSPHKANLERFNVDGENGEPEYDKLFAKKVAKRYIEKFPGDMQKKKDVKRIEKSNLSVELFNEKHNTDFSDEIFEESENIITNLIMMGSPGSGKTMLASTIFHEIAKLNYNCFFIEATNFIEILKEGFEDKEKRERLLKFCEDADLLVIDDLGMGFNSGWGTDQFKLLADLRQGKFTIYTTNLTEPEFMDSMALHRIYSRMNENATKVIMNFEDKRLKRGLNHDTD